MFIYFISYFSLIFNFFFHFKVESSRYSPPFQDPVFSIFQFFQVAFYTFAMRWNSVLVSLFAYVFTLFQQFWDIHAPFFCKRHATLHFLEISRKLQYLSIYRLVFQNEQFIRHGMSNANISK